MHFLHGEVKVFPSHVFPLKADLIKKELDHRLQSKLYEIQKWSPQMYEQFWSENGEHLLQGAYRSLAVRLTVYKRLKNLKISCGRFSCFGTKSASTTLTGTSCGCLEISCPAWLEME